MLLLFPFRQFDQRFVVMMDRYDEQKYQVSLLAESFCKRKGSTKKDGPEQRSQTLFPESCS